MIKINLLLARKQKKKVGVKIEFVILALSVIILMAIFVLLQWRLNGRRDDLLARITDTKNQVAHYKSLIPEVNHYKQLQKSHQTRLNELNRLRKEKGGAARVLDEISMGKPEKVQLELLKKDGTKLAISGVALDDETVANFMTNLRKSRFFKSVDLIVTEQTAIGSMKVKKFSLSCEILSQ